MVFGRKALVVLLMVPLAFGVLSPGSASATSSSALESDKVLSLAFAEDCPKPDGATNSEDRYRQRVVATSYCVILDRQPDDEGMDYWVGQLRTGLSPVSLVGLLLESDEYQKRSARSYKQSFEALVATGAEADGNDEVDSAQPEPATPAVEDEPTPEPAPEPETARRPVTDEAFESWVAVRDLQNSQVITGALIHGQLIGNSQRVNVAYVHLSNSRGMRVSPGDRDRATVGSWAKEIGADVAINGNWYSPYDGPAVSNGSTYGGDDHGYTAMFGMTADNQVIVEHHREVNATVDSRVTEAVSGHPTLVDGGAVTTDFGGDPTFTARHPRTAIGVDQSGDILILVTVDGRSTSARGMTGAETAELMQRLGAHHSVMLDGGGSSTMWISGRGVVNKPSGGLRAVGNQIAVFGD